MEEIRVSKSHTMNLDKSGLIEITEEIVNSLFGRNLTFKEAKAILKDALDTIESISNDKYL